jgi:DNA-binding NtrC family response regulator
VSEVVEAPTWVESHHGQPASLQVRRCRLEVVAGPDAGLRAELAQPLIVLGRHGADLTLSDPKVSGVHCELRLTADGYRLRDLGSTNGTHVRGVRVVDGFIAPGATIQLGKSAVVFTPLDDAVALPLWADDRLAGMVGSSAAMRHLFQLVDRFAAAEATVLIHGETGTGKELVADAIHQRSPRARGPFQVLDCSAIPEQLFEDQIFGHEAGAFTGAGRATVGVFEAAHGGTLFLDEIGELPLDVQAKLLRAVETRRVRRIGGARTLVCDVRIVAASNRDLAAEVNRGSFRADLYYRLAVAKLEVPPLRERLDDLELLVAHFLRQLDGAGVAPLPADFLERARRHTWPGNVRELRNAVERAALLPHHPALADVDGGGGGGGAGAGAGAGAGGAGGAGGGAGAGVGRAGAMAAIELGVPFKVAKQRLVDDFDRRYLEALLAHHDGNISAAARTAGIDRMSI